MLQLPQSIDIHIQAVSGGDICESFSVDVGPDEKYFIKAQERSFESIFRAEMTGLESLRHHTDLHVPKPISILRQKDMVFFAMTHLKFSE